MSCGAIIVLNGTSSSGKTSIVKALREIRDRPAFYVGVDHFNAMRPGWSRGDEAVPEGLAMNSALHHAVAVLAKSGWDVILEHVRVNPVYLKDCVNRLVDFQVLFVGVRCPVEVLERRERERGDRKIGIAREQCDRVGPLTAFRRLKGFVMN
jgi:chloramphenicol 3-O phosphotransferase